MNFARILRHLLTGQLTQRRIFPPASLAAIEQAIMQSEMTQGGEICFAVEAALNTLPLLKDQTARERAIEVFSHMRVWDTEHNNGVLIYLLLADRTVEIIADRGIHAKVPEQEWQDICRTMESAFRQRQFEAGVIAGIHAVGMQLQKYFPFDPEKDTNELPNKPAVF
ncbi:MAG: TPM domain-containing protein [Nitrosomonas sp.]|uniref:TPM domain-containing protein n=1 Tax=Nitrosomonas sp. TaxID=42353 RepID=UPI0025F4EA22|nr:TPM domain-containing protein [Nitrosomonas sp.]UJP03774.1 MAG: TPM domain-containing protein [Nitrosomonas sp.]UJP07826.1 MAG: TPM domain-containing protein [Nitrosomonas sp.]